MVGYGNSLERARRPGWDAAYLDYASLKSLLEEVERLHTAATRAPGGGDDVNGSNGNGHSHGSYTSKRGDFLTAPASSGVGKECTVAGNNNTNSSELVALLGTTASISPLMQQQGAGAVSTISSKSDDPTNLFLKTVVEGDMEEENLAASTTLIKSPKQRIQFQAYEASELFLSTLRKEVEKVSLFALSRQGELADAVGSLRFNPPLDDGGAGGRGDELSKSSHPLFQKNLTVRHDSKSHHDGGDYGSIQEEQHNHQSFRSDTNLANDDEGHSFEPEDGPMANELWFLLPTITPGRTTSTSSASGGSTVTTTNSSLLFRESLETSTAPRPLFTGDAILRTKNGDSSTKWRQPGSTTMNAALSISNGGAEQEECEEGRDAEGARGGGTPHHHEGGEQCYDCLDPFTFIGVELLHLLRFICVNAMGVRKILKKYDKIVEKYVDNSANDQNSKLRDDLNNIQPFSTNISPDAHLQQLTNSDSIAAITSSLLRASVKTGSVNLASMEKFLIHDEALLRFKCSIDCIDILREYANVVNEPFPAFLSRQAMIVTGYNLGGIEGMKQRALEVLLTFDPDTILLMDKLELLEWQQRCWQYTFTTGGYKMRKTTFDMVEDAARAAGGHKEGITLVWGGVNGTSMLINMMSTLLYTVNYYIIAPTANRYAIYLGTNGAFGSTLIGASSFAALFAAVLYSIWYNMFSFKSALVFSSICPFVGNLMYAVALSMQSMKVALIGRILVGFGSAEVVNRQLISACVHFNYMTKASAAFVVAGAAGMSVGPLLAALLVTFVAPDYEEDFNVPFIGGVAFNHISAPGFLMAALWFCQLFAVMFGFSEPDRINSSHGASSSPVKKDSKKEKEVAGAHEQASCFSGVREVCMLVFRNPALPVTLFLFGYIEMICEVLISSCAMVSKRYFGWDGSVPGFLIASLGALVLPAHFVVERASRSYEERVIMKNSVIFIILSLFGIMNYNNVWVDVLSGSRYIERSSISTWHEVKNTSIDDWHTLRDPLTWEHLLNETNDDWRQFQNMTSEEWSSFQNATLHEWQTLREKASEEWETISQETKDKFSAFLNATHDEWIEIRQKSENVWDNVVNKTEYEWDKLSHDASTEWKNLPNQTDEQFRNIATHVKDGWTHVNKTTNGVITKAGEEYVNVTTVIKEKAGTLVDTASDKLKNLHKKSANDIGNITENVATNDVGNKTASNVVDMEPASNVVDMEKKKNVTRHKKITNQTVDNRFLQTKGFEHVPFGNLLHLNPHSTLLPYDWGYGYYAYLICISAIFMGVIILEGVDTSLMCKTAPSKLNSTFLNVGLLATLVGTMGRVLGDGMITLNALIGLSQYGKYTDFVNSLFVPMIPITLLGFYLVIRYYVSLR
mmetsp:Transcript_13898/g.26167  ORF Transcript_13898/g.26167 Transcript_13898/m.26167 type:complete len:1367 (+) Transcript_13898:71-4171(+)